MHYLHMIRMDPSWYLQKFWWAAVLFGGILIVVTACKNRSRNAKARKRVIKPEYRGVDDNEYQ